MFVRHSDHQGFQKQRLLDLLSAYGIEDYIVEAFDRIPREKFIDKKYHDIAWEDRPFPIAGGQWTTQPSLIALMIRALNLKQGDKILEVGAGTGYQAAILSQVSGQVYTIETVAELVNQAKGNLNELSLKNVIVIHGDGSKGYEEEAPFDAIIVTAWFRQVPEPLVSQLKEGGKLIMPVGARENQILELYEKEETDLKLIKRLTPVVFVPLVGEYGVTEKQ